MPDKKIVTLGGGTGSFPVVSALKKLETVDITAIVSVSDSGGSTGRIRDEFGFQPVGDLRQSLAALANSTGQEWIQKLLLYRFSKGTGLKGHNLGNLILTALQDMTGNTTQSLEIAEQIFNLTGSVIPITASNVNLKINYTDGSYQIGEHNLDEEIKNPKSISSVELTPACKTNLPAKQALLEADVIIIGPGDLYASIMSTLVLEDTKDIFSKSSAEIIYMANLMTRRTQTHNMPVSQHVKIIESALGKKVDTIIVNSAKIPKNAEEKYAAADEYPVKNDIISDKRLISADLLLDQLVSKTKYDTAHRSLLRHDPEKLELIFKKIISSKRK